MLLMLEPLFAAEPLVASTLFGCAAAALGWVMVAGKGRRADMSAGEAERRAEIRKREPIVRVSEDLFEKLADWNAKQFQRSAPEMARRLELVYPGVWTPGEYMAAAQMQAAAVALAVVFLGIFFGEPSSGALFGLVAGLVFSTVKINNLKKLAESRKSQVRARLPFVLDLTALMMESGALFNACIQTVVQESGKHPIAEELSRVLASLRQGLPRATALKELSDRLDDTDVEEVVLAVNTSEDLGTPLDKTLRTMADRMRERRIQRLEKHAETAKVHITWPAMLVMIACLLVVAAPMMLAGGAAQ